MTDNIIDWSRYGRGKRPEQPKWAVTYSGNGRGDGVKIAAVFEPEHLDEVFASIKRQLDFWKDHP